MQGTSTPPTCKYCRKLAACIKSGKNCHDMMTCVKHEPKVDYMQALICSTCNDYCMTMKHPTIANDSYGCCRKTGALTTGWSSCENWNAKQYNGTGTCTSASTINK